MSGRTHAGAHRLADHTFLRGLDADFLTRIGEDAHEHTYETGESIVQEGDVADEFYLIFTGKVALEVGLPDRPRTTIQTLGPGEVLGWSWLVSPYRWRFDARALKPTRVLVLSAGRLRSTLEERPADGYRFLMRLLPVIAERLENTRLQLLDLYGV